MQQYLRDFLTQGLRETLFFWNTELSLEVIIYFFHISSWLPFPIDADFSGENL